MSYNMEYSYALLAEGRRMRSFDWQSDQRRDFIAMYRMGGEL